MPKLRFVSLNIIARDRAFPNSHLANIRNTRLDLTRHVSLIALELLPLQTHVSPTAAHPAAAWLKFKTGLPFVLKLFATIFVQLICRSRYLRMS